MKKAFLNFLVFCLLAGFIPIMPQSAAAQEEADPGPYLILKIPDIEKLLSDVETFMPPNPQSKATQQLNMIRMMLFGTDWIDPGRSIVAAMLPGGKQPEFILLVPFQTANNDFQKSLNAVMGEDYYLASVPPKPNLTVSPSIESELIDASIIPAAGDLAIEIPANGLISMFEVPITAAINEIETAQPAQTTPSAFSPQDIQNMLREIINISKQVDVVQIGLSLNGDIFTVGVDFNTLPGTKLAEILIDSDSDSRLTHYPISLPIKFYSRAYNVQGVTDLMESAFAGLYGQLGIDFNEMAEMSATFTGEMAGGISITQDGLVMETIAVLKPGTDGEAFIRDTYLPWMEQYSKMLPELTSQQTDQPIPMYERTADSTVSGIKVMGVRTNIVLPAPPDGPKINNIAYNTRIAAVDDLMFIASNDAGIEKLINGTRDLVSMPAGGPLGRVEFDLGSYLKGIQSLMPAKQNTAAIPENLGNMTMLIGMYNGKLSIQNSFNVQVIDRLISAIGAAASKQKQIPADSNNANAPETP
ncbi:MAG: hypothetical protein JXR49_17415 [Acidobacteria bacterium]|nr:hypothetical protein [Acidobacteriota bacterium]